LFTTSSGNRLGLVLPMFCKLFSTLAIRRTVQSELVGLKSHCILQTAKLGQGNSSFLSKFRIGVAPQSSHKMTITTTH
jgi:hypothetical protein